MFRGSGSDNLPAVDMHIHTVHCGHCTKDMTLENIVHRAQNLGLEQIAVTDHVWNEQQLAMLDVLEQEFDSADGSRFALLAPIRAFPYLRGKV